MRKSLFILTALFITMLFTQIALADTLTMPDPMDMGFDITFYENNDSQYCYNRIYKASNQDIVRDIVLTYIEKLLQFEELAYVQCTTSPSGWIFHVFDEAEDFSYDGFCVSNDEWHTKNACVTISYKPGSRNMTFRYSTDFTLPFDAFTPTPKPTAKSTAKPCSICDGTGECPDCGGDMWVTKWEWVYVNGSPESQLVTKLCDGVYCYGGSCLKCRDD